MNKNILLDKCLKQPNKTIPREINIKQFSSYGFISNENVHLH